MTEKLRLLREVYTPKESDITYSIRKYLQAKGIFCFKHWSGPMSYRGVSDILGVIPGSGKFLAIEVKRPGNPPTPSQVEFIKNVNASGGVAFIASSIEDVESQLQIKKETE